MSALHSVKCTREEAKAFKNKVENFLLDEHLPYTKIIGLCCYNGQVKIFTGDIMHKLRLRQGRKLIAFRNPDNSLEGTPEGIQNLEENGGDALYLRTNEPIEEKEYLPVYRADNWEEEKQYLKEKLTSKKV